MGMATPWANASTVKEGDRIRADGGFPCIEEGAELTVKRDPQYGEGLPSLYVDCTCEETDTPQKHFLEGQADESGALVGLYKMFVAVMTVCYSWPVESVVGAAASFAA